MSKWRKKPIAIEAARHTENTEMTREFPSWLMKAVIDGTVYQTTQGTYIKTLEGDMLVGEGDWIIQGVAGELYPCKNEIFEATYEAVI